MPKPPLPDALDEFLARPNPATIAALQPNGAPNSVATWYLWEDGRALVNMDESRARLEWLRREPRVSLTVLDESSWYRHVSLHGVVMSIEPDPDLADIDRLARHYTGERYRNRERRRFSAWIEIRSWHGWANGKPILP